MTAMNTFRENPKSTDLKNALQVLIAGMLETSPANGIQLHVDSPKLGMEWSGATGFTDRASNPKRAAITPLHPVRIASNTKTFVAAAILRLWEEQRLELDVSVKPYLSAAHCDIIRAGGYALEDITVRQLLAHTSGLFDYADSQPFADALAKHPQQFWTRTDQLQLAMAAGKPYGKPGEVYRYSDTGYILLGEIIERISGQSLGLALRQLLNYKHMGLNATWLEIQEPAPSRLPPRIHEYEGGFDAHDVHGSFDIYGGGGLISTVGDMARFMRGLFQGQVYTQPSTLKTMLSAVPAKRGGPDYGGWAQIPGAYRLGIETNLSETVYSHRGHFGTLAAFIPELDMSIALNLGISRKGSDKEYRAILFAGVLRLFGITL